MMKEISFSNSEIRLLKIWAENTIHGGHYGNGDIILPDEEVILTKVKNAIDGKIQLKPRDIQVILIWAENMIGSDLKGMTPEEISVVEKLKKARDELS